MLSLGKDMPTLFTEFENNILNVFDNKTALE
jgi:hypothetical protein